MLMAVEQPLPSPPFPDAPPLLFPDLPRKRARVDADAAAAPLCVPSAARAPHPDAETDAIVRVHADALRAALEHQTRRHCREILVAALRTAQRRLREKDAELDLTRRAGAELESRLLHLAAEGQLWFHLARNGEAMAASLRAAIEQAASGSGFCDAAPPADDAGSCCDDDSASPASPPLRGRPRCRACGDRDCRVLVLPCRHLCLCEVCDRTTSTCPICSASKDGSVQVLLS